MFLSMRPEVCLNELFRAQEELFLVQTAHTPMLSLETMLGQFAANVFMVTSFLLKTEGVCQEFLGLKIVIDVAAIKDKNEQTILKS